jgi:protein transport protein SEC23
MRSQANLGQNAKPLHKPACGYYAGLSRRWGGTAEKLRQAPANPTSALLHIINIFACPHNQVGILEMGKLVKATGGHMVLGDLFGQSMFKESRCRVFRMHKPPQWDRLSPSHPQSPNNGMMQMAFGTTLEILTSRKLKVSGTMGPVTSLRKKSPNVSDLEVRRGRTNAQSLRRLIQEPPSPCTLTLSILG